MKKTIWVPAYLAAAVLLPSAVASAAFVSESSTAPTGALVASAPTSNGNTPNATQDFTGSSTSAGIGNTFTTSSTTTLRFFTLLGAGSTSGASASNNVFQVNFGTVNAGVFTITDSETTQAVTSAFVSSAIGDYLTFNLSTPQTLVSGVTYGVSVSSNYSGAPTNFSVGTAESTTANTSSLFAYSAATPAAGVSTETGYAYTRVFYAGVPEPTSLMFFGLAAMGLVGFRPRRVA